MGNQLNTGAVIGLESAPESSYGVQPTSGWRTHQPTSGGVQDFYNNDTQLARNILSPNMMREAGEIVDRDVSPKVVHEVNKEWFDFFGPAAMLSLEKFNGGTGVGRWAVTPKSIGEIAVTAVAAGAYTVASGGTLQAGTLVYARGFTNALNNGLQVVAASSTGVSIKVTAAVLEASPPPNATLEVVGFQFASADCTATTTGLGATVASFTSLGLLQYQDIWVGGGTAAAPGAFGFAVGGYRGWARVTAISATTLTLDNTLTPQASDSGTGKTIQIFFGSWIRNVSKISGDRSEQSVTLELSVPGIMAANATGYCYATGCLPAQTEIDASAQKFLVATTTYMGQAVTTYSTTRTTGASAALQPYSVAVFNTATELSRERVLDTSGNVLCSDIDSWKMTIKPNMKGQKQQGTLGNARVLPGEFDVDTTFKAFFDQPDMSNARTTNTNMVLEVGGCNNDSGFFIRCPYCKFTGGSPDFTQNDAITLSGSLQANRDPVSNLMVSLTKFPYLPAS